MITIDRLVLDIDGMDEPRARRLAMLAAEQVAETLAGAGAPDSGITLDRIAVSLPATGAADADIAAAIAAAIRARIS
jgi:hypothetical protein